MTDATTPDDDNLLENISDAVGDVLADDVAPEEPEDPWERRERLLDAWTAVILALAAIATAWAGFQAGNWAGAQSDYQSASAIQRSDANRAASQATTEQVLDSQMWLSWLAAEANGEKPRAAFFRARFSPALDRAQKAWLGSVPTDKAGNPERVPKGTPLTMPAYIPPAAVVSEKLSTQAEASLAQADEASANSTGFVTLAVVFALVLFFASVATKFSKPRVQVLLIVLSIALLGYGLIRIITLPHTF